MREELLHFIWRFRYFNQQALFTETGEALQVVSPGEYHADQGPDFKNARIRLGDRIYEGSVEIHVQTSNWVRHAHDNDRHYAQTILHVVWSNDWPRDASYPGNVPVFVLEDRVSKLLLSRYERWMKNQDFVPCERQLSEVGEAVWPSWLDTLTEQRLQRRALSIGRELEANQQHWEAVTWIWMARSMGQPVNGAVFEAIARSLPVERLARLREEPMRLEALLLGQAGLLDGHPALQKDERLPALEQAYKLLQIRWGLRPVTEPVAFLRMRPGNFPTVRLRQLAGLLLTVGWFARVREAEMPGEVWTGAEQLSADTRDKVLINAFIPLLYAYGWLRKEPVYREKALRWLHGLRAEKNNILSRWQRLGVVAHDAGEGQALLELKKEYCTERRCLDCAIGNRWLITLVNKG
jgi:hypothetical protein